MNPDPLTTGEALKQQQGGRNAKNHRGVFFHYVPPLGTVSGIQKVWRQLLAALLANAGTDVGSDFTAKAVQVK